jgi:hypothetical protein
MIPLFCSRPTLQINFELQWTSQSTLQVAEIICSTLQVTLCIQRVWLLFRLTLNFQAHLKSV